jgi:hypothetical protein
LFLDPNPEPGVAVTQAYSTSGRMHQWEDELAVAGVKQRLQGQTLSDEELQA